MNPITMNGETLLPSGDLEALTKRFDPLTSEQLRIDGVIDPTTRILTVSVAVELTRAQAERVFPLLGMGRYVRVTVAPIGSGGDPVEVEALGQVDAVASKRKVDKDGFESFTQSRGAKVAADAGVAMVRVAGDFVDPWPVSTSTSGEE